MMMMMIANTCLVADSNTNDVESITTDSISGVVTALDTFIVR